jgi:peroxiredoxin
MIIRPLAVIVALILSIPGSWSAEGGAKLSDDAVADACKGIQKSLIDMHLQQGQAIDPAKIAPQMKQLGELVATAASPTGDAALGARVMRVQLWQMSGEAAKAEADLKQIIAGGGSPSAIGMAYVLLARSYSEGHRLEDIGTLATAIEQAKVDPAAIAQVKGLARQAAIIPGKPFPAFSFTDTTGVTHALSDYRGKILLLDFWATWCPPCVAELPNVKTVYDAHHAAGFEVVGISLDQDRSKLDAFVSSKGLPWIQAFDGKGWQNEIAQSFAIMSIPAPFLIDGEGNLIARDLRGEELAAAVKKAVEALPKR